MTISVSSFRMGAACALAALATFAVAACKPPAAEHQGAPMPIELPAAEPPAAKVPANIIESAAAAGRFSKFVAAAKAAGLDKDLKGAGPFTVFAPTDEAFNALPAGALEDLMKPANSAKLALMLQRHVLPRQVTSDMVKRAHTNAVTLAGDNIVIDGQGDTLKVGDATVVQSDIGATNGVIFAIDRVLM